jgi:RimJ/RimL family protein N-acetyltransferase
VSATPSRDDLLLGVPVPPVPALQPGPAVLEGRWVRLEPIAVSRHAPALYAASHGDPAAEALWTYMSYGPFSSEDEMAVWLARAAASNDTVFHVVLDKSSRQPVGMAAYVNVVPRDRRIEIGHIWYAPPAQRGVANTETAFLLVRHAFEELGYRRVEWKCNALNARSRAAALRLGFQYEGTFRAHMIVKGRNRDTAWFAMIDHDWPRVRANFERWFEARAEGRDVSLATLNTSRT